MSEGSCVFQYQIVHNCTAIAYVCMYVCTCVCVCTVPVYIHIKAKAVPQHTYGGAGGEMIYSSYTFTTSALDGG
jgi:hypothetical protein